MPVGSADSVGSAGEGPAPRDDRGALAVGATGPEAGSARGPRGGPPPGPAPPPPPRPRPPGAAAGMQLFFSAFGTFG
ncbi:hypothetical protein [Nocardia abscessus]|uniref:hypothetical protein n=1 Tax=Nocardia abscessus TaxID=120957 RepID=UPI0024570988|nr:hypothetical protein [Nocardia abscessus]